MSDLEIVIAYRRLLSVRRVAEFAGANPQTVWNRLKRAERLLGVEVLQRKSFGRAVVTAVHDNMEEGFRYGRR